MQRKSGARQVRIIGGSWKRTPLTVLDAPGLRPTPDRVRETVFNWLNFLFQGEWSGRACLDLFAGSGALGFEAASRGAGDVTLVELHGPALRQLQDVKNKLGAAQVRIVQADARTFLRQMAQADPQRRAVFDIVFLDPPFHQDWLAQVLPDCTAVLKPDGLLYIESEQMLDPENLPQILKKWQVVRSDRAGQVFFHLLQKDAESASNGA